MTSKEGTLLGIYKFDGMDFACWRMQIEDYLYSKKLYHLFQNEKPRMMDDDWKLLDRHVLGVIRLILSKNVGQSMAPKKITTDLMKVLSNMYEKPSTCNKVI